MPDDQLKAFIDKVNQDPDLRSKLMAEDSDFISIAKNEGFELPSDQKHFENDEDLVNPEEDPAIKNDLINADHINNRVDQLDDEDIDQGQKRDDADQSTFLTIRVRLLLAFIGIALLAYAISLP